MKNQKPYIAPAARLTQLLQESSFAISNTEPIIDDGQEHGWE
jgi:hypothetical protein